MLKPGQPKFYKLTSAQCQLLSGIFFSLEPKKVFQDDLVDFGFFVEKDFNAGAMKKALDCLVERNDSLRTRICLRPGGLRQFITPAGPAVVSCIRAKSADAFWELFDEQTSIPLFSEQLYRLTLMECEDAARSGGVHIVCHHVISDGYSMDMMHKQLELYYRSYCQGLEPPGEKLYSITDYFEADRKYLRGPQCKADRKWWFHAYNHQPDYRFPAGRIPWKCSLAMEERVIEGERYLSLLELAGRLCCSLPSTVMNLTALTVYVLTGDKNFCLYTLTHGRPTARLKKTMGCMINSVPQFYLVQPELTAEAYLRAAYADYLQVLYHSRYPSHRQILMAAKETYLKRFGYNHMWFLYSAMEYLDNEQNNTLQLIAPPDEYLMGQFYEAFLNESPVKRCRIQLSYQTCSYTPEQVSHMLDVFCEVVKAVTEQPDILLSDLYRQLTQK